MSAFATGSAVLWGAQLEIGAAATAYENPTLLAGDWLQIGTGLGTSQLVKVMSSAFEAPDGTMAVAIEPPLRTAFAGGAPVTWDKPVAYYKQTSAPQWSYRPGRLYKQGGFTLAPNMADAIATARSMRTGSSRKRVSGSPIMRSTRSRASGTPPT